MQRWGRRRRCQDGRHRVTRDRGKPVPSELAEVVIATVHPSSVLRAPPDQRERAEKEFFADVRTAGALLAKMGK